MSDYELLIIVIMIIGLVSWDNHRKKKPPRRKKCMQEKISQSSLFYCKNSTTISPDEVTCDNPHVKIEEYTEKAN